MSKTTPEASPSNPQPAPGSPAGEGMLPRLATRFRERPALLVSAIIVAALLVGAFMVFQQIQKKSRAAEESRIYSAFSEARGATDAKDRLARLRDLEDAMRGVKIEPWYLFELAKAARMRADAAETIPEKISAYRLAANVAARIETDFPASAWAALPWRSAPAPRDPPDQPVPSLAKRLREFCEKQIAWLQPFEGQDFTSTVDPGFEVSITFSLLESTYEMVIRVYSGEAPQEVANLVRLKDYFEGTGLLALQQDDPNTDTNHAVVFGSPFTKLAPGRTDIHGSPDDWVGFTLPAKANTLTVKRGRVGWAHRFEKNASVGLDPTRLVVYLSDDARTQTPSGIFGEVVDSEEALSALSGLLAVVEREDEDTFKKQLPALEAPGVRWLVPEVRPKIMEVRVLGTPATAPENPVLAEPAMPDVPPAPEPPKEPDAPERKPGEDDAEKNR